MHNIHKYITDNNLQLNIYYYSDIKNNIYFSTLYKLEILL